MTYRLKYFHEFYEKSRQTDALRLRREGGEKFLSRTFKNVVVNVVRVMMVIRYNECTNYSIIIINARPIMLPPSLPSTFCEMKNGIITTSRKCNLLILM